MKLMRKKVSGEKWIKHFRIFCYRKMIDFGVVLVTLLHHSGVESFSTQKTGLENITAFGKRDKPVEHEHTFLHTEVIFRECDRKPTSHFLRAMSGSTVGLFFTKKSWISSWTLWKMSTVSIPEVCVCVCVGWWGHNHLAPPRPPRACCFCSVFLSAAVCLLWGTWGFVSFLYEGREHLGYQREQEMPIEEHVSVQHSV